ncbi:MAG: peptidoglycan DD-metalloendopeptidase family protein [Ginsengibacter sp.]
MYSTQTTLYERLKITTHRFHPVVQFNPAKEKLIQFDFTENNNELQEIDFDDTEIFCKYINDLLQKSNAKFGFGGYNELRTLYKRSNIFNSNLSENINAQSVEEPRRLHLGIDIWGKEETEVFAPWGGMVHSFAFNNNFGDYGATIILLHQLEGLPFFTLYGHLSLEDLQNIREGSYISRGQKFAHFGKPEENGHWPPHLHFQVIQDITPYKGDYPGVCKFSQRKKYLLNCPDPDVILNMRKFIS